MVVLECRVEVIVGTCSSVDAWGGGGGDLCILMSLPAKMCCDFGIWF